MKNLLISGIAASALTLAAGGAIASDSFQKQGVSNIAAPALNGAKPGGHPGMGNGPKPGGWNSPKPGMGNGPKPGGWNGPKPTGWNGPKPGGWTGTPPHTGNPHPPMGGGHRWGPRPGGKWQGGWNAPGGWNSYHRPSRGWTVPSYWISPSFYIGNYSLYGLTAPSSGYYWSRYYDDAVLMNNQGYVADYRQNIDWNQYEGGYDDGYGYTDGGYYAQPDYGPAITADPNSYNWGGDDVGFAAPDGSSYSYDGGWTEGGFVDPEQRIYEGEWEGRVIRNDGPGAPYQVQPQYQQSYAPPPQSYAPPPEPRYAVPAGYEGYEKCLKSSGLTGGVIGAIIGGIAGHEIAGRGDKLPGTIIGAGIGGVSGAIIEKVTTKCKKYAPQYRQPAYAPQPQYYPQPGYAPPRYYPPTYQSGYYYVQPQVTTITVAPSTSVTTTTTTEEYVYETVTVPAKKWKPAPKKVWKPKPKPRCTCR